MGAVIYSGVDYEEIANRASKEADVIVWDGGNNDLPFFQADLKIVVADPHRPGHEMAYHPGEANIYTADVVVINKIDSAYPDDVNYVRENIMAMNPDAIIIDAASPISVENGEKMKGKKVVVIEDGPTLTHGEMTIGAGIVAAQKYGAGEIIDPKPYFKGTILKALEKYPHIGDLIPALGYGKKQVADLQATINACKCDYVVSATPIDITRVVKIKKPVMRVGYELQEIGEPKVADIVADFVKKNVKKSAAKKTTKKRKK
jgi:predicted GTPase